MMAPRFSRFFVACGFMAVLAFLPVTVSAATLLDASTLWKFDFANNGTASNTQITDSSSIGATAVVSATNFGGLSWTSVPATGPGGAAAVDTIAYGLQFTPVVTGPVVGVGGSGAGVTNDTVAAAAFQASNATVTGSSAVVLRMKWDGRPSGMDDNPGYQWLVSNGYGGTGIGFLFGINSTDLSTGRLNILTNGTGATNINVLSSFTIQKDVWYDIAVVFDDLGDADIATGTISFFAQSAANGFQSTVFNNAFVNSGSGSTLVVGSESAGTGNSNQRKSFNGTMDYLALFDISLTQADVQGIFAAPEPGRAMLMAMGLAVFGFRRRRAVR